MNEIPVVAEHIRTLLKRETALIVALSGGTADDINPNWSRADMLANLKELQSELKLIISYRLHAKMRKLFGVEN